MISAEEEKEFLELKKRHDQALEYEKNKYKNDSPEGKAWAEKTFLQVINRINQLWNNMSEEQRTRLKWVGV